MEFKRKKGKSPLCCEEHMTSAGMVPLLSFPALTDTGIVSHCFSTRMGGVSEGWFSSMNLKFGNGDRDEAVLKNYEILAEAMGCSPEDFVCSDQTHTTNIREVTAEDRGKGVVRPKDYHDVDGLITRERGIVLSAFFADCVPLYFVDPVHRAIGLSHSGWRGTVHRMGEKTVEKMREAYDTDPRDLICAIGPSICQDCYEVGEDVASEFRAEFPDDVEKILRENKNGRYQLDLWKANELVLRQAGILPEHILVTDICTCCNADLLFSHRATHGRRGNLGAFLKLN